MAHLSAAGLRDEVREAMLAQGLCGFVRIAPEGGPLLVTDCMRRAGAQAREGFLEALEGRGLLLCEHEGLLFLSPGRDCLQDIVRRAESVPACEDIDWRSPLAPAQSFAQRLLRDSIVPMSDRGEALLAEVLRLPDPQGGWPALDRLRPRVAVMLREHDRGGLHEAGALLWARLEKAACQVR